ncbi:MAG: thiamine phosphate synthase [Methylotetracoccus sp.]
MASCFPDSGLYAITRESGRGWHPVEAVEAAIRGGARLIQYREKNDDDRKSTAIALLAVCRRLGVPLIINDDIELARRIQADGVHLGRDDGSIEAARERLGPGAIIGVSCYDSVQRASSAERAGADYVAFGRFFPSRTKPAASLARVASLIEARRVIGIPIAAIGGITPSNGGELLRAGADFLAVIDAVFGEPDPEVAARDFAALFASIGHGPPESH